MTKKQAIEILDSAKPGRWERDTGVALIEDLARAGAFQSEALLVEIIAAATEIISAPDIEDATSEFSKDYWIKLALRLAAACRAAGLVPQ